ncbi:MAG: dihydroorotate dehydrogenase electron transfer subunit [Armatimonadota bacterium]
MAHETAEVVWNESITQWHYLLALKTKHAAAAAQPGQFIHVRVGPTHDPLLRRPLSVLRTDPGTGQLWVLVRVVGRGTRLLAEMEPGARLDIMGPLGRGWPEPPPQGDLILVAGGVGVAPLIFWAEVLQSSYPASHVLSIFGAAHEGELACWLELAARSDEFYVATEDGSAGEKGLAVDLLRVYLDQRRVGAVYACGPRGMLAAAARLCARASVPCYVAMEQWMGCGIGACLGCVVPAAGGGYVRVCTDGPVFRADELDWEVLVQ